MLGQLYEDWLQAGGDWGKSTIVANNSKEKTTRKKGRNCMKTFRQLRETFGLAVARQIRDNKKRLQASKKEDEEDFWRPHPECPDAEDLLGPSDLHPVRVQHDCLAGF